MAVIRFFWLVFIIDATRSTSSLARFASLSDVAAASIAKIDALSNDNGTYVANIDELAQEESSYLAFVVPSSGQFLTTLALGTPPVSFTAILDTGSDLIWRQCLPCKLCYPQSHVVPTTRSVCDKPSYLGTSKSLVKRTHPKCILINHTHPNSTLTSIDIFNPSLSSSYSKAPCSDPACLAYSGSSCSPHRTCAYNIVYIAPSAYTRGILSYDTLTILPAVHGRPKHISQFAFGCSHSSKAPYNFAGAGGIAGFGRSPLSLPSQLNVSRFSYCLGSINDTSLPSPLVLGAAASLGASSSTQSLRIVSSDYDYVVELDAIGVAGEHLNVSSSSLGIKLKRTDVGKSQVTAAGANSGAGIIFDSGTTFTHLPREAFRALVDAFRSRIFSQRSSASPRNLTLCYEKAGPVPSLSFHFKGATMELPVHNYFMWMEGVYCLAISESGDDDLAIFGNVQQQNYHILYDLKANVISFKPVHCHALQVKAAHHP